MGRPGKLIAFYNPLQACGSETPITWDRGHANERPTPGDKDRLRTHVQVCRRPGPARNRGDEMEASLNKRIGNRNAAKVGRGLPASRTCRPPRSASRSKAAGSSRRSQASQGTWPSQCGRADHLPAMRMSQVADGVARTWPDGISHRVREVESSPRRWQPAAPGQSRPRPPRPRRRDHGLATTTAATTTRRPRRRQADPMRARRLNGHRRPRPRPRPDHRDVPRRSRPVCSRSARRSRSPAR